MRFHLRLSSSFPLLIGYALVIGAVLGLGSAYFSVKGGYPFGAVQAQGWTYWPKAGSYEMDPYARAITVRSGGLPLGLGEGLLLVARKDEEGRSLRRECRYQFSGSIPPARFWTLFIETGEPLKDDTTRQGFTSAEVLRRQDNSFEITLSKEASPGNWLPLEGSGRFSLNLRLYDSPASSGAAFIDPQQMPVLKRLDCVP